MALIDSISSSYEETFTGQALTATVTDFFDNLKNEYFTTEILGE